MSPYLITCGDIGEGQREIELEPLTVPAHPIKEPTPTPQRQPQKEPVPA